MANRDELLEKLVSEQINSLREISETLRRIENQFTNGFRSDIKKHIDTAIKSPFQWLRIGAIVFGVFAGTVATVLSLF